MEGDAGARDVSVSADNNGESTTSGGDDVEVFADSRQVNTGDEDDDDAGVQPPPPPPPLPGPTHKSEATVRLEGMRETFQRARAAVEVVSDHMARPDVDDDELRAHVEELQVMMDEVAQFQVKNLPTSARTSTGRDIAQTLATLTTAVTMLEARRKSMATGRVARNSTGGMGNNSAAGRQRRRNRATSVGTPSPTGGTSSGAGSGTTVAATPAGTAASTGIAAAAVSADRPTANQRLLNMAHGQGGPVACNVRAGALDDRYIDGYTYGDRLGTEPRGLFGSHQQASQCT